MSFARENGGITAVDYASIAPGIREDPVPRSSRSRPPWLARSNRCQKGQKIRFSPTTSRESLMCREYTLQDNGHLSDIFCFGVCPISDVFTAPPPPPPYSTPARASHNTLRSLMASHARSCSHLAPSVLELRPPSRTSHLLHPRLRLRRAVDRLLLPADVAPADPPHLHPRKRPVDREIRDFPHCVPALPAGGALAARTPPLCTGFQRVAAGDVT